MSMFGKSGRFLIGGFALCIMSAIPVTFLLLERTAMSAEFGTSKSLRTLLNFGVPPDSINRQTFTAMGYAASGRQMDTIRLLASKGADIRVAVQIAVYKGDLEMLDCLAQYHPLATLILYDNKRVIDEELLCAAMKADAKTCAYLIHCGADPNFCDTEEISGATPLSIIANSPKEYSAKEKNDTIKVLIAAGARETDKWN